MLFCLKVKVTKISKYDINQVPVLNFLQFVFQHGVGSLNFLYPCRILEDTIPIRIRILALVSFCDNLMINYTRLSRTRDISILLLLLHLLLFQLTVHAYILYVVRRKKRENHSKPAGNLSASIFYCKLKLFFLHFTTKMAVIMQMSAAKNTVT